MSKSTVLASWGIFFCGICIGGLWSIRKALQSGCMELKGRGSYTATISRSQNPLLFWIYIAAGTAGTVASAVSAYYFFTRR